MSSYAAYWGYPRVSMAIERPRLNALLAGVGDRPCVLAAGSGAGKTIAAAQFIRNLNIPNIWVSFSGQDFDRHRLLRCLAEVLAGTEDSDPLTESESELLRLCRVGMAERSTDGLAIVLDDAGPGCMTEEALRLYEAFRCVNARVVATTRQRMIDDEVRVIDEGMLFFTPVEVRRAARAFGRSDLTEVDVEEVIFACGGHPALTTLLLAGLNGGIAESAMGVRQSILRASRASLTREQQTLCDLVRLVRKVDLSALESIGYTNALFECSMLSRVLPLITLQEERGRWFATAHDLLCVEPSELVSEIERSPHPHGTLLALIASSGDSRRLESVLRASSTAEATVAWLETADPFEPIRLLGHQSLLRVIETVPLELVVGSPGLMLLWATVLYELGRLDEAMSKGRIALALAEHDSDQRRIGSAGKILISALAVTNRAYEALRLGRRLLEGSNRLTDGLAICQIAIASAMSAAILNDAQQLEQLTNRVEALNREGHCIGNARRSLSTIKATMDGFLTGDWGRALGQLMPLVNSDAQDDFTTRVKRRGNVAAGLVERGRLNRAEALLGTILFRGDDFADGSYQPTLGAIRAATGDPESAIELVLNGIRMCAAAGDELDCAHDRIYLSVIQRAEGLLDDSLVSAERARECVAEYDFGYLTESAITEVGASLLALGDTEAARAWVEPTVPRSATNGYEALRAAMVLAECDRRDGRLTEGLARLRKNADQVRSENSNWQMAMYVRTFPHLLGMLSSAVGPKYLPVHMLRMILPEHAEPALRAAESLMESEDWAILGRRVLGDDQFEEFLQRKGRPMCRVRLFGGLEVCVDDRVVQERDWAKRKGRSIFAMLAARQGQELARDQILEHLWPEMDSTRAKNNFYVAWSSMKAALRTAGESTECMYVDNARGRCRVVREWVRSDLDEFDDLLAAARAAETEDRIQDAASAYSQLMTVYRGELLAGDLYDDWFATQREHYRVEFLDAMLRATQLLLDADQPSEALMFARRGLAVDPYREDLYQDALRCHIQAGQRSAAIETFLQCKAQLADELGLDPSADTLKLYEQVLAMEERSRYDASGLGFLD